MDKKIDPLKYIGCSDLCNHVLGGTKSLCVARIWNEIEIVQVTNALHESPLGKDRQYTWCRHQMGTFNALLVHCKGNPPVDSPIKGQWRRALMSSLIYAWTNGWANNRDAGDMRRHRTHIDVTVMASWHGNAFGITGLWCGEILTLTKAKSCRASVFLCFYVEHTVEQHSHCWRVDTP